MVANSDMKATNFVGLDSGTVAAASKAAIQKLQADLARSEHECAKWKVKAEALAIEMERRSHNENRNCIN